MFRNVIIGIIFVYFSASPLFSYAKPKPSLNTNNQHALYTRLVTINPKINIDIVAHAVDSFDLTSEVMGKILDPKQQFVPGRFIKKGQRIVKLDDTALRYNYFAQKSTFVKLITQLLSDFRTQSPGRINVWRSFLSRYTIKQKLPDLPKNSSQKEKNYLSAKNIFSQYYLLKELEDHLGRFTFIAPFSGTLVSADATHLDVVQPGIKLGRFVGGSKYRATIALPYHYRQHLKPGSPVILAHDLLDQPIQTKIKSISQHIDPISRHINAYIEFSSENPIDSFILKASITGSVINNVSRIPLKYLTSDNHVIILQDDQSSTRYPVDVVHHENNFVVLKNIPDNTQLVPAYQ